MIIKKSAVEYGDFPTWLLSGQGVAELNSMQCLGSSGNTLVASGDLGGDEAVRKIMTSGDADVSDYEAINNVETTSYGQLKIFLQELGTCRHRLRAQAIVVNNAQSNVAVGAV